MLAGKDKAAQTLLNKHEDYFLGPLAPHKTAYDGDLNNNARANDAKWVREHQQAFLWKNGYIHRLRLAHDSYADDQFQGRLADVLELVLEHPSGQFIVQMNFNSNGDPNEDTLDDLWATLAKRRLPTLRKLIVGDNVDQISWYKVGDLGKIWKAMPNLRHFQIEAGQFELGAMDLPNIEHIKLETGGLSKTAGRSIATAKIPKIQHLEIFYGDPEYGGDCSIKEVKPLLERDDLKSLTYLGLKNSMFADDIAKEIPRAKIVKGLKTLDLSLGAMTDEGALALAAKKDALKHLDTLDLTRNFLTKKGIDAVKGLCKNVITGGQEKADEYEGTTYYYVAVAE